MMTAFVLPSSAVLELTISVFVRVIVPLQANKTVPPPAKAVCRAAWVQVVTVPEPKAQGANPAKAIYRQGCSLQGILIFATVFLSKNN
jgi:hypothetical protein